MDLSHKERLHRHSTKLIDQVTPKGIILHLLEREILSVDDFQRIRNAGTDCDQMRQLLITLPDKGPQAYFAFKEALLREKYEWLVKNLDDDDTPQGNIIIDNALNSEVTMDHIKILQKCCVLLRRWRSLTATLGVDHKRANVEHIVRQNGEDLDQCVFYVIEEWKQLVGRKVATVANLLVALRKSDFNWVADELEMYVRNNG